MTVDKIGAMTIDYLADHPHFIPTLAQWQHEEWGYIRPGDSVEARTTRIDAGCERDRIPLTVVAIEDGEIRGSASLIHRDMDTRPELSPWLASVFVAPEFRRRGTGAQLVRRIMSEAGKLEVPLLYLYTVHSEKFYAELGWTVLERTSFHEQQVVIMTYRP